MENIFRCVNCCVFISGADISFTQRLHFSKKERKQLEEYGKYAEHHFNCQSVSYPYFSHLDHLHELQTYDSLDESIDIPLTRPLIRLDQYRFSDATVSSVKEKLQERGMARFYAQNTLGESAVFANIEIYGNMGVMQWTLSFSSENKFYDLKQYSCRAIDKITSDLSTILFSEIRDQWQDWRLSTREDRQLNIKSLFHNAEVLWTARTAIFPNIEQLTEGDWLRRWSESDNDLIRLPEHQAVVHVSWGNCALAGRGAESYSKIFETLKARLQYLYTSVELISKHAVEAFYHHEYGQRELRKHLRVIDNDISSLTFIKSTLFDFERGTQGEKFMVFIAFRNSWRLTGFVAGVKEKLEIARAITNESLSTLGYKLQKNVQSLIVAIGMIEILGAFVEIIDLAHKAAEEHQNLWGVLYFFDHMNSDTLITAITVVLALLMILIIYFGLSEGD